MTQPNEIDVMHRRHCENRECRSSRTRRFSICKAKADYYKRHRTERYAMRFRLKAA